MSEMVIETESPGAVPPVETPLTERLERLEQENAQLKRQGKLLMIGGAAVLGILALMLIGRVVGAFSGGAVDVIEARRFVLRDADGMLRGVWEMTDNGSSRFILRDRDGRERMRLALLPDGSPGVTLADRDNRARTVWGVLPDQTASLVFADQAGKTRAVLGVPSDGSSTLVFADRGGETRVGVGVDAAGKPGVTLYEDVAPPAAEPIAPIDEELAPTPETEEPPAPGSAPGPQ